MREGIIINWPVIDTIDNMLSPVHSICNPNGGTPMSSIEGQRPVVFGRL
jgi:hypothetical protein